MSEEDGKRSIMVGHVNYRVIDGWSKGEFTPDRLLVDLANEAIQIEDLERIKTDPADDAVMSFWTHMCRKVAMRPKNPLYQRIHTIAIKKLSKAFADSGTFNE